MFIYCNNCKKENSRTDKFCINCGFLLETSTSMDIQPLTQTERKIWSFRTDTWGYLASSTMDGWGYMGVYSSPCVSDGFVYFGSYDRNLYCLNVKTGRENWRFTTCSFFYYPDGVNSSPCVADGRVYAGCCARRLYCIDAKEGRKIWDFETGNIFPFFKGVESSPCISDGYVYFGCNDGNLYCLDTGKRGITAGNTLSGQCYNKS